MAKFGIAVSLGGGFKPVMEVRHATHATKAPKVKGGVAKRNLSVVSHKKGSFKPVKHSGKMC